MSRVKPGTRLIRQPLGRLADARCPACGKPTVTQVAREYILVHFGFPLRATMIGYLFSCADCNAVLEGPEPSGAPPLPWLHRWGFVVLFSAMIGFILCYLGFFHAATPHERMTRLSSRLYDWKQSCRTAVDALRPAFEKAWADPTDVPVQDRGLLRTAPIAFNTDGPLASQMGGFACDTNQWMKRLDKVTTNSEAAVLEREVGQMVAAAPKLAKLVASMKAECNGPKDHEVCSATLVWLDTQTMRVIAKRRILPTAGWKLDSAVAELAKEIGAWR